MRALLLAAIDVPEAYREEFDDWYDSEHVPERAALPGFGPVSRWERVSGDLPRFLALYPADGPSVLDSGPYGALKARGDTPWTARLKARFERVVRATATETARYSGGDDPTGGAAACVLAITTLPPERTADYHRWYDTVHGPAVAAVPGIRSVRRYADGTREITLLGLDSPDVLTGAGYAAAKAAGPDAGLRAVWRREQGVYTRLPERAAR
jgi:hypothetical protein